MESSTTTTATPPAPGASKRQRKAALPLGDLTNLLPSTPAPRNPSARRRVPPAQSDTSACSSTPSSTPVSKASSAAGGSLSPLLGSIPSKLRRGVEFGEITHLHDLHEPQSSGEEESSQREGSLSYGSSSSSSKLPPSRESYKGQQSLN